MSKVKTDIRNAACNDAAIIKYKEWFERYYRPPYRLAVKENDTVSIFAQIQHGDAGVMCGLVMELNAGRAGRGGKAKSPKRHWLFVDKKGGEHKLDGGTLLKSLGVAELKRRNTAYLLFHRDTGKQGYAGPKPGVGDITDPNTLRVVQSQLGQMGAM